MLALLCTSSLQTNINILSLYKLKRSDTNETVFIPVSRAKMVSKVFKKIAQSKGNVNVFGDTGLISRIKQTFDVFDETKESNKIDIQSGFKPQCQLIPTIIKWSKRQENKIPKLEMCQIGLIPNQRKNIKLVGHGKTLRFGDAPHWLELYNAKEQNTKGSKQQKKLQWTYYNRSILIGDPPEWMKLMRFANGKSGFSYDPSKDAMGDFSGKSKGSHGSLEAGISYSSKQGLQGHIGVKIKCAKQLADFQYVDGEKIKHLYVTELKSDDGKIYYLPSHTKGKFENLEKQIASGDAKISTD